MARYELASAAAGDLENIFEFGIDTFGLTQALDYMSGLKQRLRQIADQPEVYPAIEHIRSGYRRSVYKSHATYFWAITNERSCLSPVEFQTRSFLPVDPRHSGPRKHPTPCPYRAAWL